MKNALKRACGMAAYHLLPQRREALRSGAAGPDGPLDQILLGDLIRRSALSGDHSALRSQLSGYWKGTSGDTFYESFQDRFEEWFLGPHYEWVEALDEILNRPDETFSSLLEIGCGDGRVLHHLSEKLKSVENFTGIDINERIIARNRDVYSETALRFESGDASKRLGELVPTGSIVMTYGGVMEYLLESELRELFRSLKARSTVIIALVEPLYDGFDLENETASRASGTENSFTHPYPLLLRESGFEIEFQKEPEMEFRWMMIIARR